MKKRVIILHNLTLTKVSLSWGELELYKGELAVRNFVKIRFS